MLALLASFLAAGALAGSQLPPRLLVAGPALAGSRVVWGEQDNGLSLLRAWPDSTPLWQSASSWFAGPLAGSQALIAFSRSYDGCPGRPGLVCPVQTQALVGPPRGSLRPLAPAERCTAGGTSRRLAVSGTRIAVLQLGCDSSGQALTVREGTRVLFRRQGVGCCGVSLAGDYLAWRTGTSVDLFNLRTRRLAYEAAEPRGEPIAAFDVQADGKLELALGPAPDGLATLAWRAPGATTLHRLGLRVLLPPSGPVPRLVGDHIIAETVRPGAVASLVVADLDGRVRTLARFAAPVEPTGAIDATEGRVTWASRRIGSTRVDCPPPGQERPCRLLKTGIQTIWLADVATGTPRAIARWAFTDAP